MTTYVVLSKDGELWRTIAEVDARSAEEAIRQAASSTDTTCVAVPARSWKPVSVRVEQTSRMVLGGSA